MTSRKGRKPAGGQGRGTTRVSGEATKSELGARASKRPPASLLRHDTPRDLPAVVAAKEHRPARPEAPREPPPRSEEGLHAAREALSRVRSVETLESAYDAWLELRQAHAASRLRFGGEHERLLQQGSFLVGAVRAASEERVPAQPALVSPGEPLHDFLRQAEEKLARAREALAAEEATSEAHYQTAFAEIRATLEDRARRHLAASPPRLRLLLRKVGASRAILHVERLSGDEPVLLLYLLTSRLPSRHGFLLDDSTENVSLPPAPLYPEEGVAAGEVRPEVPALEARVRSAAGVLPLKGFLPVFVPRAEGGEDFFRLLQRGPVMEVELAEGSGFRALLSREESERFAGHLLRLKLAGRIELEVEAG